MEELGNTLLKCYIESLLNGDVETKLSLEGVISRHVFVGLLVSKSALKNIFDEKYVA